MLAAGLATSMAQVYSLNVVGYVNVTLPPQAFTCVANPLDATSGGTVTGANDITNLFATGIASSSTISTFNSTLNDYNAPIQYTRTGWNGNTTVNPGQAVMFYNNGTTATTVTFVGQVVTGPYTVGTLAANSFTMVGSPVPIGGSITNSTLAVGLVPSSSDTLATFSSTANDWVNPASWSTRTGWSQDLQIAPGQGFLYYNNSSAANTWTSNFTVQ